jgi:mannose-1-phosphate guanylyltransferase
MLKVKCGIEQVMILAAGQGKRARPLSLVRPKPLFPVNNRTLLYHWLKLLSTQGLKRVWINHSRSTELYEKSIRDDASGLKVELVFEPLILGTGGGLRNALAGRTSGPVLVVNAAVHACLDLSGLYAAHESSGAVATLVMFDRPRFNLNAVDSQGRIKGFRHQWDEYNKDWRLLGFTGIYLIESELIDKIPQGFADIIETFQKVISEGGLIQSYEAPDLAWEKVETPEDYLKLCGEHLGPDGKYIHPAAEVHPDAELSGWVSLGADTIIEKDALVQNSILWEGAKVMSGVKIVNSILADNVTATHDLIGEVKID